MEKKMCFCPQTRDPKSSSLFPTSQSALSSIRLSYLLLYLRPQKRGGDQWVLFNIDFLVNGPPPPEERNTVLHRVDDVAD